MGGVVLLTGGTGFLGSQVVRGILKSTHHTVVALVRARDAEEAKQRIERAWHDWPEAVQAIGNRVEPLVGDLQPDRCPLEGENRVKLLCRHSCPVRELRPLWGLPWRLQGSEPAAGHPIGEPRPDQQFRLCRIDIASMFVECRQGGFATDPMSAPLNPLLVRGLRVSVMLTGGNVDLGALP
jgi:hypothetical protein